MNAWSGDSRYIYCLRVFGDPAILRIPVAGGDPEVVADLKGSPLTGFWSDFIGLDPGDTPLILRDVSTRDVYALTLEGK